MKLLFGLTLFAGSCVVSYATLIYGWGLDPQNNLFIVGAYVLSMVLAIAATAFMRDSE